MWAQIASHHQILLYALVNFVNASISSSASYGNRVSEGFPPTAFWEINRSLATQNGFRNFEDVWSLPGNWVEEPNYRRGGWSAVSVHRVSFWGVSKLIYVKRQEGQLRRTLGSYLRARPTYWHEKNTISTLFNQFELAPELLLFGESSGGRSTRSILATAALDNYQSLSELLAAELYSPLLERYLSAISRQVALLHSMKIAHGALFPNHIYINPETLSVKFIDFERSRRFLTQKNAAAHDYEKLFRRNYGLNECQRKILLSYSVLRNW